MQWLGLCGNARPRAAGACVCACVRVVCVRARLCVCAAVCARVLVCMRLHVCACVLCTRVGLCICVCVTACVTEDTSTHTIRTRTVVRTASLRGDTAASPGGGPSRPRASRSRAWGPRQATRRLCERGQRRPRCLGPRILDPVTPRGGVVAVAWLWGQALQSALWRARPGERKARTDGRALPRGPAGSPVRTCHPTGAFIASPGRRKLGPAIYGADRAPSDRRPRRVPAEPGLAAASCGARVFKETRPR